MVKAFRVSAVSAAIGLATLSLAAPGLAGNGSAIGAGLAGFGIGTILGSALAPRARTSLRPFKRAGDTAHEGSNNTF